MTRLSWDTVVIHIRIYTGIVVTIVITTVSEIPFIIVVVMVTGVRVTIVISVVATVVVISAIVFITITLQGKGTSRLTKFVELVLHQHSNIVVHGRRRCMALLTLSC